MSYLCHNLFHHLTIESPPPWIPKPFSPYPFFLFFFFNTNDFTAAISFGLIYKAAEALMNSDEFINDPRHPRFAKGGKFIDLEKKD